MLKNLRYLTKCKLILLDNQGNLNVDQVLDDTQELLLYRHIKKMLSYLLEMSIKN